MMLRSKTFLPLALFSALFFLFLYGYWFPRSMSNLEQEELRATAQHLSSVAEGLVPLLLAHELDAVYGNLDALLSQNREWVGIRLINPAGKLIYPILEEPLTTAQPGRELRVVEHTINYLGGDLGRLILVMDISSITAPAEKRHRQLVTALLTVFCGYLLCITIIVERVVRRPVNLLAHAAEALATGDFDVPLIKTGNDEVGILVNSFAGMRDAIRNYQMSLRESTRTITRLSQAVEQSPVSIMITDTGGRLTFVNPTFSQVSGYGPEEVLGKSPEFLNPDTTAGGEYETIWRTITAGNIWNGELCSTRRNGDLCWESVSISPIRDENGAIMSYMALKEDITERKRGEEMLHLQAVELEDEVAERQMAQESLQEKALQLEEEIKKRQKAQEELQQLNGVLEQRVQERTAALEEKNAELHKLNKLFVGRELRMIELKERIREMEEKAATGSP